MNVALINAEREIERLKQENRRFQPESVADSVANSVADSDESTNVPHRCDTCKHSEKSSDDSPCDTCGKVDGGAWCPPAAGYPLWEPQKVEGDCKNCEEASNTRIMQDRVTRLTEANVRLKAELDAATQDAKAAMGASSDWIGSVRSIGTCARCGYHGPGPSHDCATRLMDQRDKAVAERDAARAVLREQAEVCERLAWECEIGITDGKPALQQIERALRAALEEC